MEDNHNTSKTISDYFFNLTSENERTFSNFLMWSFTIFMVLICASLLLYIDAIAESFNRTLSIIYIITYVLFFGSHMWFAKNKIAKTNDPYLLSHLNFLRLGCTVQFYLMIAQLIFTDFIARIIWLDHMTTAAYFAVDVFFIFVAYTSLKRQRQNLPYGFDDD